MTKAELHGAIQAVLKIRMLDPREIELEAEGEAESEAEGEAGNARYRKDALYRSRVDATTSELMMIITS